MLMELLTFTVFSTILFFVCSSNGADSALTSKGSLKVNLLNTIIYCWTFVTIIVSSFGQIEQGVQFIKKSLIYSTRKVLQESEVVELVY